MYRAAIVLALCLLLGFYLLNEPSAHTYYVSNAGDDANAGTSADRPWQTVARVNATRLAPGDQVLFAGGQAFSGGIQLRSASHGTAERPIVFQSYGTGQAVIHSGDACGFWAPNVAGIELRRLAFLGSGRLKNETSGVVFRLDSADTYLQHLRLDSLDVSGYRDAGVSIGSAQARSGYADVRITRCQLHDNGEAGLASYAFFPAARRAHRNWYVGGCTAYDNAGRADVKTTHTGNGIVLSGIDGALVEHCTAYRNGWLNANPDGGPVGIWGWDCHRLVVQHCEAHHNQSGTAKDGGGFDLDGGCTHSVLQYNYAHDNQGPGYLLAQFAGAPPMHDLAVRYNISENDARGHGHGAIEVWSSGANGGIVRANIHNNTVCLGPPADGSRPKAVYISSGGIQGLALRNNVFQTSAGLPVLVARTAAGLRLEGNCYWSPGGAIVLDWNGTTYKNLAAWRAATGQETLGGSAHPTGLCADPRLLAAGAPGAALAAYRNPAPALRGTGLNLRAEFGLNPGPHDFFANPTPGPRVRGNVGAVEAAAPAPRGLPAR